MMTAQMEKTKISNAVKILKNGAMIKNRLIGRVPTQNSMVKTGMIMTNAVPKSGCLNTIIVGNKAIRNGTTRELKFFILRLWSDKYRASAITITHLAISEGCNPKGSPKFIHRYVPAIFSPKNGRVTAMIIHPYIK